jgi:hypothetical protein
MIFFRQDEEEEMDPEDEEASLADDLLDEVGDEPVADVEEEIEGFGLLEKDVEEEDDEEDDEDEEEEASLDEDAEDVDFDTFDDVDEM